jgi:hypothetical protein
MVVREEDDEVDFEFNFELFGNGGRTGEQAWEDHEDRDGQSSHDVSVADLNVLNLRRFTCFAFHVRARFHTDQLQFNALDIHCTFRNQQLTGQRQSDVTVRVVQLALEQKLDTDTQKKESARQSTNASGQ